MIVKPRHYELMDDRPIREAYGPSDTLILECEVIEPPSSRGRKVMVWLDPEDVTKVLLLARESAIAARSKPMPTP